MSNFQQRLILSALLVLILSASIYFSFYPIFHPIFTFLVIGVVSTALWEFYHITEKKGTTPLSVLGVIGSGIYIYTLYLATKFPEYALWPVVVVSVTFFAAFLFHFRKKNPINNLAATFFGFVYVTLPLATVIPINFSFGRFWLVYLLLVTKMTDTVAYFCGKWWGKHKLAPMVSPQKTWEGALGGSIASVVTSILLYLIGQHLFHLQLPFTLFQSLWLGILLSILAQLGDLAESLIKRDAGVKDSSHLPGLGGMLDIVDALIFTAPALYLFLKSR